MELAAIRRHHTIEVHIILCKCTRLIEAAELNDPANHYLVLRNTEYLLLVQALESVDDPKGHAHGQGRRHCYQYKINELYDDFQGFHVFVDNYHNDNV
jgi:predicted ATPase